MPDPSVPPPLKVTQAGGSSYIPVFELVLSGGTVTKLSPIKVQFNPTASTGVAASRNVNTVYPLSGGGDLSVDRTHSVDTGGFLVLSSRVITTTSPMAGGGNLSVDRTITVDTAAVVTSGRSISTLFPLSGGGDLSANRTFAVDTAFLVNTSRQILTGTGLSGGGNLSADRTISLVTPVSVTSGGTGQTTITAFGILYGSGASAVQATVALNSGQILVGSMPTAPPRIFGPGSDGQYIVSQSGAVGGFIFVGTPTAGGGPVYAPTGGNYLIHTTDTSLVSSRMLAVGSYLTIKTITSGTQSTVISTSAKTVRFPMALATVAPDSANAFWVAKSGTTVDQGFVAYADSGVGWSTYWARVPMNLSPVPAWSLLVYNSPNGGNGGVCIFSVSAKIVAPLGSIDSAYTNIVSVGTIFAQTNNIMGVGTTTATNFDGTLAITSGDTLFVEFTRHGNLAGDAVNAQWNLYSLDLQCDVV